MNYWFTCIEKWILKTCLVENTRGTKYLSSGHFNHKQAYFMQAWWPYKKSLHDDTLLKWPMKNEKSHLNLELRNVNIKLNCVLISSALLNNEILLTIWKQLLFLVFFNYFLSSEEFNICFPSLAIWQPTWTTKRY